MDKSEPPVSEKEIDDIKDLKAARLLAKKFPNGVSLKKCSLPKMKERLQLALQKWNGEMKDINALGEMMKDRRQEDRRKRHDLLEFFVKMKGTMELMEERMKKHIGTEYRNIDEKIGMFIEQLNNPAKKIVVAGETSSGKSTVLNIFLNDETEEEMLPVKLLSCTATMCEIQWAQEKAAKIVTKGVETEVPFNERHQYIYKPSERESMFPHDLVRLQMPVPFLESGVSLVDSPGIGENTEMGNVIKEYVMKNDVFGFVFTVASNRAGGVLKKFLNLLRTLSSADYVDEYGQRKLDPRSCIFVANFWDEVPPENKVETKEHIFKTLQELPFMRGFNPREQIFFLDASFAYNSRTSGYISKDFGEFIDGLGAFVWEEQKRKLKASYDWIENALQRILHPVRGFIRNMNQTRSLRRRNKGNLTRVLDELEHNFKEALKDNKRTFESKKKNCITMLLEYMQGSVAKERMRKWKIADMPTEEADDNWVILEMKLDETIDERVSDIMQDWEKDTRCISNAERELTRNLTYQFEVITDGLEVVERDIRSTGHKLDIENETEEAVKSDMVVEFPKSPEKDRDFKIAFGQTHGSDIMGRNGDAEGVLGSVSSGPTMKALKNRFYKQPATPNPVMGEEMYRKNKLDYMTKRAEKVFAGMCEESYVASVVADQLRRIENFLSHIEKTTTRVIASNRSLMHQIAEEKRNKQAVENLYSPRESDLQDLFEEVLQFGNGYMMGNDFEKSAFLQKDFEYKACSLYAAHAFNELDSRYIVGYTKTFRPVDVTLWKHRNIRLSERYSHVKFLRQFKRHTSVARLLGTCTINRDHLLVLEGHLKPARKLLMPESPRKHQFAGKTLQTQLNNNTSFLRDLANALLFLHLKKLVHCEFSLDSVMIKTGAHHMMSPLLCNLSEPTTLSVPQDKMVPINQYIHIPVEVLHGKELYSKESDMYGLGIIMLELWYQRDVFADFKKDKKLGDWCPKEDPGEMLIKEAKLQNKNNRVAGKLPPEWKELAQKCLHKNVSVRPGIRQWLNEWDPEKFCASYSRPIP